MKSPGLTLILMGVIFSILGITLYSTNPSFIHIPYINFSIVVFITGLFQIREYYNKKVYFAVVSILLLLTWILGLGQIITIFDYISLGVFTIVIIFFAGSVKNLGFECRKRFSGLGFLF